MAKRVPEDDGSNLPLLEITAADLDDDTETQAGLLIEYLRRLGVDLVHMRGTFDTARRILMAERRMKWADAKHMPGRQVIAELRAVCVERGLLGDNSPEADHQPKAPARKPDEAPRPDVIGVVGLLAGVQAPNLPLSRLNAYESLKRAKEEKPELKGEPLKKIWLWLQENDPHPDYKLPRFGTWTSYIREYRRAERGVVTSPRAGRPHGPSVVRRDQF